MILKHGHESIFNLCVTGGLNVKGHLRTVGSLFDFG